jgi:hypothetical protein
MLGACGFDKIRLKSVITFACPPMLYKDDRNFINQLGCDITNVIVKGDIVAENKVLKAIGLKRAGRDIVIGGNVGWGLVLRLLRRMSRHTRKGYWKRIKKRWPK